ncbi:MAG: CCA tRNA nucleotidyltransferase [Pseudomonadota bacterium]
MSAGPLTPLSDEQRQHFTWLDRSALKKVVAALEKAAPGAARFVGGCVRDSLLGVPPKDFDIATPLTPERVVAALDAADLRSAPTGLAHGTVTAIADGTGVEVTTLRRDVSTDGRRATVAFTDDWAEDARRRDFRLNAIYLGPDGFLFDPVGGVADAAAGRVRFIGDPRERIREDYLRILRFFRFSARIAASFDSDGLAACHDERAGVAGLSAERVGAEFLQILALARASDAAEEMARAGVLDEIWPGGDIAVLQRIKEMAPSAPGVIALAGLYGVIGGEKDAGLARRLRLSNADKARASAANAAAERIGAEKVHGELSPLQIRVLGYRHGIEGARDGALLAAARSVIDAGERASIDAVFEGWRPPALPVSGRDILAAGVAAGPAVAAILRAVEERWLGEDFPDAARAQAILGEEVARSRG